MNTGFVREYRSIYTASCSRSFVSWGTPSDITSHYYVCTATSSIFVPFFPFFPFFFSLKNSRHSIPRGFRTRLGTDAKNKQTGSMHEGLIWSGTHLNLNTCDSQYNILVWCSCWDEIIRKWNYAINYNINTVNGIIKYRKPWILYLTACVFKIVRYKIPCKQTKKMLMFIFTCEED